MKYYKCDLLIFSSIKASWYKCKVQCKFHFHPKINIHTPSNGVIANLQCLSMFFLDIIGPYLLNIYYWEFVIPNKNLLLAHDLSPITSCLSLIIKKYICSSLVQRSWKSKMKLGFHVLNLFVCFNLYCENTFLLIAHCGMTCSILQQVETTYES